MNQAILESKPQITDIVVNDGRGHRRISLGWIKEARITGLDTYLIIYHNGLKLGCWFDPGINKENYIRYINSLAKS